MKCLTEKKSAITVGEKKCCLVIFLMRRFQTIVILKNEKVLYIVLNICCRFDVDFNSTILSEKKKSVVLVSILRLILW